MIIFDAGLEEDSIQAVLDRATELVSAQGGESVRVDKWGKRRFAYDVAHRAEGYYALLAASADPGAMTELDRMLSLTDEVVRYKVVRLPENFRRRAQRPAPQAIGDQAAAI